MTNWIVIPSIIVPLIIVGAVASRFFGTGKRNGYTGKYDPKTGLGRGAPGFQTGVKRVAVTPEIAARMRAGEQVSPEEIEAAVAKMEREKEGGQGKSSAVKANPNVDQDWLPQGQSPGGKKGKRR